LLFIHENKYVNKPEYKQDRKEGEVEAAALSTEQILKVMT
jgi:hypothetical protein